MAQSRELSNLPEKDPRAAIGRNPVLRPTVDIFEDGHEIRLLANLPGVAENAVDLEVNDNTLTIEGEISVDTPAEMSSLHAEIRSTHYRRAFTLSKELDSANISASMRDGLLAVTIPKREEVRPRKIEIAAE